MTEAATGTLRLKTGLAEMLAGGVIMDVTDAAQARIAYYPEDDDPAEAHEAIGKGHAARLDGADRRARRCADLHAIAHDDRAEPAGRLAPEARLDLTGHGPFHAARATLEAGPRELQRA